jgi:hypothetical protein
MTGQCLDVGFVAVVIVGCLLRGADACRSLLPPRISATTPTWNVSRYAYEVRELENFIG